jgi:hypothetical protein
MGFKVTTGDRELEFGHGATEHLGRRRALLRRGRAGPQPWTGAGHRLQQPWREGGAMGGERAAALGLVLAWG